jgi:hypothetical protein
MGAAIGGSPSSVRSRGRPKNGAQTELPAWMARADEMRPLPAAGGRHARGDLLREGRGLGEAARRADGLIAYPERTRLTPVGHE